jgi:predicted ABC-type ATPase
MPEGTEKRIIIIAGPNGAGKTTFALEYLPNEAGCPLFVNADLIAEGLSPFDPSAVAVRAGRLMLDEINRHARSGVSFAFETTLAGRRYAKHIPRWKRSGYRVCLVFLQLQSEALAIERVAVRVRQGGHDVPAEVIRRRFKQGWWNFQNTYRELVDSWQLYDNSGKRAELIEEG